jgi:transcriptional regulator PpsR
VRKANGEAGRAPRSSFLAGAGALSALPADEAASLIAAASDIALVIDPKGVIEDLSTSVDDLPVSDVGAWVGRHWSEVVTPESRPKVQSLLHDAGQGQPRRWRHVNHPGTSGHDFPVMYAAVPVGSDGRVLAVGRDVRSLAGLQQRLVDAQQTLERDYWRLRHAETRFQLLFDTAADAILIVDGAVGKVIEANAAAQQLLGQPVKRLVGQPVGLGLPDRAQREIAALMGRVRASGRSEESSVRGGPGGRQGLTVGASLFVEDDRPLYLLRLRASAEEGSAAGTPLRALAQVIERAPDGFVVTDPDGRVLTANAAFLSLAQMTAEDQLIGTSVDRWLGRPGVDLQVMLATLRQQGNLRLFGTVVHGEHGVDADVEVSAVAVPDGEPPCLGFTVRHVGRRLGTPQTEARGTPRSVEQLTQLVGRMPLKDLVRESTDLIEQLCIEAALQLTQGNRASAAEMLGLSRQSLYVKLHRYGMAEPSTAGESR